MTSTSSWPRREPRGTTMRPVSVSCAYSAGGTVGAAAATATASNGASSGTPSDPSPTRTSRRSRSRASATLRHRREVWDSLDRSRPRRRARREPPPDIPTPCRRRGRAPALEREERADRRDDERLRDRLAMSDRESAVVVGVRTKISRDEVLARNPRHRVEDALVDDAAATQLLLDHARPCIRRVGERAHFASVRSPAKRAAWRPRMRAARSGSATAST